MIDFVEKNLSLADVKQIFSESFIKNLQEILYNGNLGDMLMNPEITDITRWFRQVNPTVKILANTNGGARPAEFWKEMARLDVEITFGIDGLDDTHHLYRQNTIFSQVIKNAQTFMEAGGRAIWKMIRFQHNEHQIDDCQGMAKDLGFSQFQIVNSNRGPAHVYDRHGNYSHSLEGFGGHREYEPMRQARIIKETAYFPIKFAETPRHEVVSCMSKNNKEIYVNSLGEVYPCCFLGHNPRTLDPIRLRMAGLSQMAKLLEPREIKISALEHGLETCLEWFAMVEDTWKIDTFTQGRMLICDEVCGKNPSETGGKIVGDNLFWETTDQFNLKERI